MYTYAVIEIGGEQLVVEPGRFYNIRNLTLRDPKSSPSAKVSNCRVLMICRGSTINMGRPWVGGAVIKGRVLRNRNERETAHFYGTCSSKLARFNKSGHRKKLARFVVDNICLDEEGLVPALDE
uniref:Ribosomal protein L21 n=1 Tax=Selaginella lepidophylla TaxID=59777 RepID=A0A3Q9R479_SELLP|nr:ribosomal protein L21 [Selaginella lepidophylla]AZU95898.1 ribosomal protein L21 [Selaginella lepidophylla]